MASITRSRFESELPVWTSDSGCTHHGSNVLSFRLGLTHDNCLLFEPADFSLQGVTALVGTNGCGKSSLCKTLPFLPGFPSHFKVEYVCTDEGSLNESRETPTEFLRGVVESKLKGLRNQIDELESASYGDLEEVANRLAGLYEMEESIEESSEREIQKVLGLLRFDQHENKTLAQLSSGWRYKCRLVAAFLLAPDLLILDEPSFLDHSALAWLVDKIKDVSATSIVLIVSHKEALLEAVAERILYINSEIKKITTFNCGYVEFKDVLESQRLHANKTVAHATKQEEQANKSLKDIQKQLRRGETNLKSKTTQNADQRFIKGKSKEGKQKSDKSIASKVKHLRKHTAELQDLQRDAQRERVQPLHVDGTISAGALATLDEVSFAYEGELCVFENVDAKIGPTDRIQLCGPNGVGKSTLVKLILGEVEPTKGRLLRQGKVLYFPQTAMSDLVRVHGKTNAVTYLGKNITETEARHHLGQFGLKGNVSLRSIGSLSAGQRVRLWLAAQTLRHSKPSFLILDEISENVDVDTRESLLELLNSFVGAVLVISHDPDFSNGFRPNQIWTLHPNGLHIEYRDYQTI